MNIFMLIALLSFMDVDTADEVIISKDMSRAQRRHNTQVAIAKKKAKKTCRKGSGNYGFDPWWNSLDEQGNCEKPCLSNNKSGNVQHKAQQHRWDTYTYSSKKNTWKKMYDAPDVEHRKYFDKVDTFEEERYAKKSEDFARFLMEQDAIDLRAGELLDEFENYVFDNYVKMDKLYEAGCVPYVDANRPGEVYFVEPECIRAFRKHMEENGACLLQVPQFEDHWEIKHVVGVRARRNPGLVFEETIK